MVQVQFKGRKRSMFQIKQSGSSSFLLLDVFVIVSILIDCLRPAYIGEDNLLNSVKMLISSRNVFTDISKIMFDQMSGHLMPSQTDT
jgi:hypothetical protein